MVTHRLAAIVGSLGHLEDPDASLDWLCRTCAKALGMGGAAVALISSNHDPGNIAASDERVSYVVDLQFTTGEGPTIDAHRDRRPVLEPELETTTRWPAFASQAVAVGVAAVFGLPLQIGAANFGVLTFYRERPGPLGGDLLVEALAMADVACEIALRLQAQVPPGSLHDVIEILATERTVVYQATGMIAVQMDVGLEQAMALLRARAYAAGQPVHEVAADVVARRFRFDP
ncbi:MAG: ANTAR domain-containing protein [Acidimicrobiales bacterium]|jgi:ANTAR domain-containing protein